MAALWFASSSVAFSDTLGAEETGEFEFVEFDSDTLLSVTNLARSISGVNATTATFEDNVAAILDLLQKAVSPSSKKWIHSTPMWVDSQVFTLGQVLQRWLSDTTSASSFPAQDASYLYQIQRALVGQAGIPSQNDSLLPTLWRIEDILAAAGSGGGGGSVAITNDAILGFFNANQYVDSGLTWAYIWQYLTDSARYVSDVYESNASNASEFDSALRVVDPLAVYYLGQLTENSVTMYTQLDSIIDELQGITGAYAEAFGTNLTHVVDGVTNALFATSTNGIPHPVPDVAALDDELGDARDDAVDTENDVKDELSDYATDESYALPVLSFSSMIPGSVDPISRLQPNWNTPNFTDNNTIPILATALQAGNVTIPAFGLDVGSASSTYRQVIGPWSATVGSITSAIWTLAFAIACLALAKYEWNQYMALSGPINAAHERAEKYDYDGFEL